MKKTLSLLALCAAILITAFGIIYTAEAATAAKTNVGGTGLNAVKPGYILFGGTTPTANLATSTNLFFDAVASRLTILFGSTTALSATTLCLSTDCRTVWPSSGGSGSGSVATSTNEVAKQVAVFSSNSATPATIAGNTAFTFDGTAARLTVTYASTTAITATTFFGNLTGNVTGNVTGNLTGTASLATALGANGTNCSNQAATGVDASGNAEGCFTVSNFAYPFPAGATSSPLMLLASTTIGGGTAITGLTVSGGATTTGDLNISTSGSKISFFNGDVTITHSADTLTFAGGVMKFASDIYPNASGGSALGSSALPWAQLWLPAAGFIDWGNTNVRLTQSTGKLTLNSGSNLTFDFGSTTALSATTLCLSTDCRTVWPSGGGGTGVGTIATSTGSDVYQRIPFFNSTSAFPALLASINSFTFSTTSSTATLKLGQSTSAGGIQDIGALALEYQGSVSDGAITLTAQNGSSGAKAITVPNANGTLAVSASSGVSLDSAGNLTNTGVTSIVAGTNISISGATGAVTVNCPSCTGGGSSAQGSTTAQFVIYPSDQTSNPSTYYLYNASSTVVTSSSNFQTLLAQAVSSLGGGGAYSGTAGASGKGPGGGIYITPGTFYTNATTTINGNDQASTGNGPSIRVTGSGQDSTKIVVVNNATFLAFDHVAIPSVSTMSVYVSGGARGLVATSSNPGTRSITQFNFDNLLFAATTTTTVAPINMGNILRGQFENIEFFGVHGCAVFNAEGNFNPGDFMWERTFCEMDSTAGAIALNFASSTGAIGYVNQVHFTQFDAIANGTGAIYIKANPLIWSTFDDMGVEQFDTYVDSGNGFDSISNTYNFKYFTPRNAAGLTLFKMAAGAQGNTFTWKDSNNPQSVTIISDVNGNPGAPNMISGYIGQDAGTASVSDSGGWLIIRDITGYGTMDTNLEPAGHPGVFTFIGTLLAKGSQAIVDFTLAVLRIPYSAAPTIATNGDIGVDSTANQLQFESGGTQHALVDFHVMRVSMASSTWGVGTTTLYMGPAMSALHFTGAYCETSAGTLQVSLYDGTNRSNFLNASTTKNFNTLSTNTAYAQGTSIRVDIGTPATSPTAVGCDFKYTYDIQ